MDSIAERISYKLLPSFFITEVIQMITIPDNNKINVSSIIRKKGIVLTVIGSQQL